MRKLRDILLTQYIGAITIGLVLAQAIFGFVNAFVQAVATYIAIQKSRSVLGNTPTFSWANFITSMITVLLYVIISLPLIRWLYSGPTPESGDEASESPGAGEER